ncbi:MAG: class IV adenylate cyclase [Gemmatimonadaceae bacterium]|nr:class IV adenylate cyclase [Gemmatimonadaceae bacterium]
MREVEVKGVVPDPVATRAALQAAGATRSSAGTLRDRRYDTPSFDHRQRDEVLRVRVMHDEHGDRATLDLKGPTTYPDGFKVREEIATTVGDVDALDQILLGLGLQVTREIEREVEIWELHGATLRFEVYPRMDVLLEVEGSPESIERAIAGTGIPRSAFTAERLADFIARFEARTGGRAALCGRELRGDFPYRLDDA